MKKSEIPEINEIINRLVNFMDYMGDFEQIHENALKDLLIRNNYKSLLDKNLRLSEIHVIDCIGKNRLPNSTYIAKELNLSKGAISKIMAKLLAKGFIKDNRLEDNKKEIYYTLTSQGKDIYQLHAKVHDIENKKLTGMLSVYSKEELRVIGNFLENLQDVLP